MGMSTGGGGPRSTLAEINVTPLVDVMLVLLIIFMVTAPLIKEGVEVDLPETQAQEVEGDEDLLILTIDKDRRVYLGENELPFEKLREKLSTNARIQAERELHLHADRSLSYGMVVEVMAIMKDSGVDNIAMITDPVTGPPGGAEDAPEKD